MIAIIETPYLIRALQELDKIPGTSVTPVTLIDNFKAVIISIPRRWATLTSDFNTNRERALEYATGGYYEGKEEKTAVAERLGVFIEPDKLSKTFYDDQEITVWSVISARALEKKKSIPIKLSCAAEAGETKVKGEIIPAALAEGFEITSMENIDFACRISNENVKALGVGNAKINLFATFDFETTARLKTYFMDGSLKRASRDIDIFKQAGITDKSPVTEYTSGPVKIGAETAKDLPIAIDERTSPKLGLTIDNQWEGKIRKVKEVSITVPAGVELTDCHFTKTGETETTSQYTADLTHPSLRYDTENLEKFFSINCIMANLDKEKLLGKDAESRTRETVATRFINFKTAYTYELQKEVRVAIQKAKTNEPENQAFVSSIT